MNKFIYVFLLFITISVGKAYSQSVDNYAVAQTYLSKGDIKKGFEYMQKSAFEGNSEAMATVGVFYASGYGTDKNTPMAINWLTKASDRGIDWACMNLGMLYEQEEGFQDMDKAIHYYKKGIGNSAKGYVEETVNLASLLSKRGEYVEAMRYWELAANEGSAVSMFYIGRTYLRGTDDVPIDYAKAYGWFLKGAEQSEVGSIYNLGYMHSNGLGVEENQYEAFKWYLKAAELEDPYAEFNLGYMYVHGEGVDANLSEAIKWYQKSANHGFSLAFRRLGYIYSDSESEYYNMQKAVKYFTSGTEAGDDQCMFELGKCYGIGDGVESDPQKAIKLFHKGAEKENADCLYILGRHYWEGLLVSEDKEKAFDYMLRAIKAGSQEAIRFMYDNYKTLR